MQRLCYEWSLHTVVRDIRLRVLVPTLHHARRRIELADVHVAGRAVLGDLEGETMWTTITTLGRVWYRKPATDTPSSEEWESPIMGSM